MRSGTCHVQSQLQRSDVMCTTFTVTVFDLKGCSRSFAVTSIQNRRNVIMSAKRCKSLKDRQETAWPLPMTLCDLEGHYLLQTCLNSFSIFLENTVYNIAYVISKRIHGCHLNCNQIEALFKVKCSYVRYAKQVLVSRKRCKIYTWLSKQTSNRKSYTLYRLAPLLLILSDFVESYQLFYSSLFIKKL